MNTFRYYSAICAWREQSGEKDNINIDRCDVWLLRRKNPRISILKYLCLISCPMYLKNYIMSSVWDDILIWNEIGQTAKKHEICARINYWGFVVENKARFQETYQKIFSHFFRKTLYLNARICALVFSRSVLSDVPYIFGTTFYQSSDYQTILQQGHLTL